MTKSSNTAEIFESVSKYLVYAIIALLPVFFLPWTANALDFNKQTILIVLGLLGVFAWMIASLISGEMRFNITAFHIPVLVFFVIFIAATVFSLWSFGSFWGWPQVTSESLLSVLGCLLVYLLISNTFSRKQVFNAGLVLFFSSCVVMVIGALQMVGEFIFPFDFAKAASFNTIGTVGALGVFIAVLLPLIITLIIGAKRAIKTIAIIAAVLSFCVLLLINSSLSWWLVGAGSALIIIFGAQKRDLFDNRWLVLPMFFLGLALFCGFFKIYVTGLPQRPLEVSLTQKASFDIVWQTIKERPVLGSGPGTFVYDFAKHKSQIFNQSQLWNIKFESGSSKMITILATTGILGALSFLAVIGSAIFYGMKLLMKGITKSLAKEESYNEKSVWLMGLGMFVGFVVLVSSYFFYYPGLTLDFLFFLFIAGLIVLVFPERKEVVLKPSSLLTLGATFVFTMIFIFGLGIMILEGQRYMAELSYFNGAKQLSAGHTDGAITEITKAASLNQKVDFYWRNLAQAYVQKLNETFVDKKLSQSEATQKASLYVNNAINAAKLATDVNPENALNWSLRGDVYQSLMGLISGVEEWALKMYDETLNLDPLNPALYGQKGLVALKEFYALPSDRKSEGAKFLKDAKDNFNKAIELKSDYAPARFQIAMVAQAEGKIAEAIKSLEDTKQYAPFDTGLAFQLGLLYYQDKDYDKAQAELERATTLDPNYANALYFLGLVYDKQGERNKAIAMFTKVSELNPGNTDIKKILDNLKAGKKALDGISPEVPPQEPVKEKTESK